jgi:hypothetical protein
MNSLKIEIRQVVIKAPDLGRLAPADINDEAPFFDINDVEPNGVDALKFGNALRRQHQLTVTAGDARLCVHHFR